MAEYEGLLAGLRAALSLGIKWLVVQGDSQLVISQVYKKYQCLDPQMLAYREEVHKLEKRFTGLCFRHVWRALNSEADKLARLDAERHPVPLGVFEEKLTQPSAVVAPPDGSP